MITKILDNNLTDRTDNLSNVVRALIGSWGVNVQNDGDIQNIYAGREIKTYIYSGKTITNLSANYPAIAIISYTDGTSEIKVVDKASTITTSKEIKVAIVIAQNL